MMAWTSDVAGSLIMCQGIYLYHYRLEVLEWSLVQPLISDAGLPEQMGVPLNNSLLRYRTSWCIGFTNRALQGKWMKPQYVFYGHIPVL